MKKMFSICLILVLGILSTKDVSAATLAIVGGQNIAFGQTTLVNGNCPIDPTLPIPTGSIPVVLDQNGNTHDVGYVSMLGSEGQFQGSISIGLTSSNIQPGAGVLKMVCPEGSTSLSTPTFLTGNPTTVPMGTSLNFGTNPALGNAFNFNGICGTTAAGGNVNFSITQNGTTSNLGSTTTTGNGGDFTGSVNFGSGIIAGPATITATCPGGGVITSAVNITDPNANTGNTGSTGSTGTTGSTSTGTTGGTSTGVSSTPTGGVAAGNGVSAIVLLSLALIVIGVVGFTRESIKKSQTLA